MTRPSDRPNAFARAWFALLAVLAALELVALVRRRDGDTLSEYVRAKSRSAAVKGLVGGLLTWLAYHWLYAPPGALTGVDAVASLAGVALGLVAHGVQGRRRA